jgi:hypothetical protein
LHPRLLDLQEMRLREMDKHGIEMMILSLKRIHWSIVI